MNKTRKIEWYIFIVYTPTVIDWSKKQIKLKKNISKLLVSFQPLFSLNWSDSYSLESISRFCLKSIVTNKYPDLKKIDYTTFPIEIDDEYTNMKQGIILYTDANNIKHINTLLKHNTIVGNPLKNNYYICDIKDSIIKNKKINIFKSLLKVNTSADYNNSNSNGSDNNNNIVISESNYKICVLFKKIKNYSLLFDYCCFYTNYDYFKPTGTRKQLCCK
jgi:hypothetical protein